MRHRTIFLVWAVWKFFIFLSVALLATRFSVQSGYLGGGVERYFTNPALWGFANYDGSHYLTIVRDGYLVGMYYYFPLYPITISLINSLFRLNGEFGLLLSGLIGSSIFHLLSLIVIFKFASNLFDKKIANHVVMVILLFPFSFFFNAVYTESLFLLLASLALYFTGKKNWFLASIFCALATATRLAGLALVASLLVQFILHYKVSIKELILNSYKVIISPLGLISYMLFLNQRFGDPLIFWSNIENFGQQRSETLVLLPQVFFRYVFRIIPASVSYPPAFVIYFWELLVAVILLLTIIYMLKKKFPAYLTVFSIISYLLPTFSGSFSSLPRYALAIVPSFFVIGILVSSRGNLVKALYYLGCALFLVLFASMFVAGYWVS